MIEVTQENGKIVSVSFNGKPITAGSMRGLRKAQETPYWRYDGQPGIGYSPFGGSAELEAIELSVYNWCKQWELLWNRYDGDISKCGAPIQTFDDMKYLILETNPGAYSALLD